MKVLLTGITGNLGFEIAHSLISRGVEIVPIIRRISSLKSLNFTIENAIEADLAIDSVNINLSGIDCIIHSAGSVHFEKSGDLNSKMMQTVIKIAKSLNVPIYHISTAFLWRELGSKEALRNHYEHDKYIAEELLSNSGIPHTIFRPSVLVGNSRTGKLINWTGYYILVSKFLESIQKNGTEINRFPKLLGFSDMVPVDEAAEIIAETVIQKKLNTLVYITNPEPPKAQWVLDTTLEFFGVQNKFDFLTMGFSDYKNLQRTDGENILYNAGKYFSPYWSLSYNFPQSTCKQNYITKEYVTKTLESFKDHSDTTIQ